MSPEVRKWASILTAAIQVSLKLQRRIIVIRPDLSYDVSTSMARVSNEEVRNEFRRLLKKAPRGKR
jgi:hypothetical protein